MNLGQRLLLSTLIAISPTVILATSSYLPPGNIRVTNSFQLDNEEQVWICPTDSNIIIANWRDFRLGYRQVGVGRSTDGGQTWTDSLISQAMEVFFGNSQQSDPTMTVDRLGNFYMSVLDWDAFGFTNESYIAFYKSIDKGVSWTGPVIHVPVPNNQVFEDKQFITVDRTGGPFDGNLYCTWARFPNIEPANRMAFVRSIDGGASFEDTIIIGPPQSSSSCGSNISSGQFPIPVVNSNGDLHCFWLGIAVDSGVPCNSTWAIKQRSSTDGGASFGAAKEVLDVSGWSSATNGINIYSNPVVDADISGGPFDGNMYMAFTNFGPEDGSRADVDLILSTDNGVNWSNRVQINDDANSSLNDSFHPWLIVNDEGVVILIFYDTRFDPPAYLLFDLMAAYSFDGGQTFTTNHRISSVSSSSGDLKGSDHPALEMPYDENGIPMPPMISSRAGLIGEYIGVTAFHDKINAVWTDSRDGNSEVYTANWYLPKLEPRLIAPLDSAYDNDSPTFSWATAWKNNEDSYRLEISDDPSFTTGVQSFSTDTNFILPAAVLPEGAYYWRVKAFDNTTPDSSEFSETRVLLIDNTAPAVPSLLLPIPDKVTSNATPFFDWTDVTKISAPIVYDMYISSDSIFQPDPFTLEYKDISESEFTIPDPLTESALTYWRIVARDLAGNTTNSEVRAVTYIEYICGDANNDSEGPNILDLTFLVDYIFRGGPLPVIPAAGDLDGSGGNPNIIDLTTLVDYIFRGGGLPTCGE